MGTILEQKRPTAGGCRRADVGRLPVIIEESAIDKKFSPPEFFFPHQKHRRGEAPKSLTHQGVPPYPRGVPVVLDRILHHSPTINIKGNSNRLKEKVKAGLIREPEIEQA